MSDEETSLADAVATSASGPQEVAVAGMGSSKEHDLDKQIAAAKFMPSLATRRRQGVGARLSVMKPGGAA